MRTSIWIGAAALAGVVLAAGLRRMEPETLSRPTQPRMAAVAPASMPPAPTVEPFRQTAERLKIRPEQVADFVAASREVVRELRRIQLQRQSEWSVDVDQQTRLEWEERYDADRRAAVARLDPFLDGGESHREFLDRMETWAATVWARDQGVYR